MKETSRNLYLGFVLLFLVSFSFYSCEDKVVEIQKFYVPEYMSVKNVRKSLKFTENTSQKLENPGKMYFKDNYLFINERYKGIHIFDNSNPSSPQHVGYITVPGCIDIAISGNILYADSYIDLVAIDIKDLSNITEVKRIENVFEPVLLETAFSYGIKDYNPDSGLVVDWKVVEVEQEIENTNNGGGVWGNRWMMEDAAFTTSNVNSAAPAPTSNGTGGSMARFTIHKNYLYTVNSWRMNVFDIYDKSSPVEGNEINVGWNAETLFTTRDQQDKLFIGTSSGMLIYDLSIPATPEYLAQLSHFNSCDPVVVEGNTAYVTLRGGTRCGGYSNQLDIIDISNLTEPKLIKTYPMTGPYGLGIDAGTLFICDGDDGLKVYNANDAENLQKIKHFSNINTYDVIPLDGVLMMIGADGLYQYDYDDLDNLQLLSVIRVEN